MIIAAIFLLLVFHSFADASDGIYQCADGTFTNRVDLHCSPYASPAPFSDGSAPPSLTLRRTPDELSKPASSSVKPAEASSRQCAVYGQWLELERQSSGGATFATAEDRRRWTTLSRMYRYLGVPRCAAPGKAVTIQGTQAP